MQLSYFSFSRFFFLQRRPEEYLFFWSHNIEPHLRRKAKIVFFVSVKKLFYSLPCLVNFFLAFMLTSLSFPFLLFMLINLLIFCYYYTKTALPKTALLVHVQQKRCKNWQKNVFVLLIFLLWIITTHTPISEKQKRRNFFLFLSFIF